MKTFELSFGILTVLRHGLAEVIVNEGIEIDLDMVDEYHMCISEFLPDPCGILVNKKNKYTYTFEAQMNIGRMEKIKALAMVVYSDTARIASEAVMKLPPPPTQNMKIFSDRDAALQWLGQQVGNGRRHSDGKTRDF